MLLAALILNLVILVPLVSALAAARPGMDVTFGPDSDARRILTCVYAAIGLISVGLIWLHIASHPWAVPMTVALFSVQIAYKLATAPFVGLGSPVVITNLFVVAVQGAALSTLI